MVKISPSIKKERIFKGFSTAKGNVPTTLYDIELIKRDLLNHFNIRKGEVIMDPEFGTIIWDLLFEPFTENIKNLIIKDVTDIAESDPRVKLVNVEVDEEEKGITIYMDLIFRPFDVKDSLIVTFYREEFNEEITV